MRMPHPIPPAPQLQPGQPSLVTQMIIAERYGTRVSLQQLASELRMAVGTIRNQVSAGTFPIPTFLDAGGRFADYRDVAAYVDRCRERAQAA